MKTGVDLHQVSAYTPGFSHLDDKHDIAVSRPEEDLQ